MNRFIRSIISAFAAARDAVFLARFDAVFVFVRFPVGVERADVGLFFFGTSHLGSQMGARRGTHSRQPQTGREWPSPPTHYRSKRPIALIDGRVPQFSQVTDERRLTDVYSYDNRSDNIIYKYC